ncbi:MAG: TRAM domain-containing protein [Bryobacterales bacterium]|nr:TRAM domain-containing protein [Bryobacterales bacterium]
MDALLLLVIRAAFIILLFACGYFLVPFDLSPAISGAIGAFAGALIVLLEIRLKQVSLKRLMGAAAGSLLGIIGAFFVALILERAFPASTHTVPFLQVLILLWMGYVGLLVGTSKGDMLNLSALGGLFGGERIARQSFKVLDTSVIIDGRIADIAETGFIGGTLVIPQFVLRELQFVADSADPLKRNRGRRGLDILQRIQKLTELNVQILEDDFPNAPEVDMKLIEMAKKYDCSIVTNDFNLNKVAQLHGVHVLNINELANALKPVVLPGEAMRVFILKEGKEFNQGVAYLDDGTMVVVDNARRLISKTVDITVTSVLQTTAGKMIFGRYDERSQGAHDRAAAEKGGSREGSPANFGGSGD